MDFETCKCLVGTKANATDENLLQEEPPVVEPEGNMTPIARRIISTVKAPKPVGPYNQAVVLDRTVYISGCLGMKPQETKLVDGGAVAEARQALKNIGAILTAAGSSYEKVVKTTILLDDIADFQGVNDVYKEFFSKDFPARSTFQVGKLPLNAKVEIEVIAGTGNVQT